MTIDMQEFLNIYKSQNINIIDIRSKYIYELSHINKSINIPYEYLLLTPEKYLNPYEKYYLYCQAGYTSKEVSKRLIVKGYNPISINGGYISYKLNMKNFKI